MITCSKADLSNEAQGKLLVELLSHYARDIMGGGEDLTEKTKGNLVGELGRRPFAHVFFAKFDDVPAGLAICFEGFSTFACAPLINIHDLCVVPSYRRKGVASTLLFFIAQYAKTELNCCKLTLEVLEGNHAAKKCYLEAGFVPYGLDADIGTAQFWQKSL
jgi:GNAT superfamily N-acetyltransferase